MKPLRSPSVVFLAVASLLLLFSSPGTSRAAEKEFENFNRSNFDRSTTIDNEWFPLESGTRLVWDGSSVDDEGKEEPHRVVFTVTDLTKVIDGVRTVVCWDQDFVDDELVETEIVFFAQDNEGTVWHLGQYPEEYEDGELIATPGWLHGVKDGRAGIYMPAKPKLGDPSFSQGWAPSIPWTDRAVVYRTGEKVSVPVGSFDDVLVFEETSKEEPDAHALKYYARGVGIVRVGSRGGGDQENLELIKVEKLSAEELAEVRKRALVLEANSREHSADVFAQSQPVQLGTQVMQLDTKEELREKQAPADRASPETGGKAAQEASPVRKISDEQAKDIALRTVPGEVMTIDVETKLGKKRIVVEVIAEDGTETDVIIDMETGEVLGTET